MESPRAAPSEIPQTSLGFRGHLITNFPHIMVLLIINNGFIGEGLNINGLSIISLVNNGFKHFG